MANLSISPLIQNLRNLHWSYVTTWQTPKNGLDALKQHIFKLLHPLNYPSLINKVCHVGIWKPSSQYLSIRYNFIILGIFPCSQEEAQLRIIKRCYIKLFSLNFAQVNDTRQPRKGCSTSAWRVKGSSYNTFHLVQVTIRFRIPGQSGATHAGWPFDTSFSLAGMTILLCLVSQVGTGCKANKRVYTHKDVTANLRSTGTLSFLSVEHEGQPRRKLDSSCGV